MRPVARADVFVERILLGLKGLASSEPLGRHADVLYVPDLIALRQTGVVYCAWVPDDHVFGLQVGFLSGETLRLEPFNVFLAEQEDILFSEFRGRGGGDVFRVARVTLVSVEIVEDL